MTDYLLDTNILLRVVHKAAPEHPTIMAALATVAEQGGTPFLTPQVLIEFWAVATRPVTVNGFGWTPDEAVAELSRVRALFPVLPDHPAVFEHWLHLVQAHAVSGKQVHDTRLVAVMLSYDVTHLLTLNATDFERFNEIVAVRPADVGAAPDEEVTGEAT